MYELRTNFSACEQTSLKVACDSLMIVECKGNRVMSVRVWMHMRLDSMSTIACYSRAGVSVGQRLGLYACPPCIHGSGNATSTVMVAATNEVR